MGERYRDYRDRVSVNMKSLLKKYFQLVELRESLGGKVDSARTYIPIENGERIEPRNVGRIFNGIEEEIRLISQCAVARSHYEMKVACLEVERDLESERADRLQARLEKDGWWRGSDFAGESGLGED